MVAELERSERASEDLCKSQSVDFLAPAPLIDDDVDFRAPAFGFDLDDAEFHDSLLRGPEWYGMSASSHSSSSPDVRGNSTVASTWLDCDSQAGFHDGLLRGPDWYGISASSHAEAPTGAVAEAVAASAIDTEEPTAVPATETSRGAMAVAVLTTEALAGAIARVAPSPETSETIALFSQCLDRVRNHPVIDITHVAPLFVWNFDQLFEHARITITSLRACYRHAPAFKIGVCSCLHRRYENDLYGYRLWKYDLMVPLAQGQPISCANLEARLIGHFRSQYGIQNSSKSKGGESVPTCMPCFVYCVFADESTFLPDGPKTRSVPRKGKVRLHAFCG
jgi:hypothetical protein